MEYSAFKKCIISEVKYDSAISQKLQLLLERMGGGKPLLGDDILHVL